MRRLAPGVAVVFLAGCLGPSELPPPNTELAGKGTEAPPLLPMWQLLAQAGDTSTDMEDAEVDSALDARAAALRARAARLRGASVGPQ